MGHDALSHINLPFFLSPPYFRHTLLERPARTRLNIPARLNYHRSSGLDERHV